MCHGDKTQELDAITSYFGIRNKPQCAVMMDNSQDNKRYADARNISFVKVDPHRGITMSDFRKAVSLFGSDCDCKK